MRLVAPHAPGPLSGTLRVPGDKSLSHRGVLFAALAEGRSRLAGVLDSADVRSTVGAVRALGAIVDERMRDQTGLTLEIHGWGTRGPIWPAGPIDCGNSGTTARLLLGVLAGWPVRATLVGDESLSTRPMGRVTTPLEMMGARFDTSNGHLPVSVEGGRLHAIGYDSPVASAQVKTAVLLAGLRAEGRTLVREPNPSRDHTERLLPAFGVDVGRETGSCTAWVDGPALPHGYDFAVPADPSSAAFVAVAALVNRGSSVRLPEVALNPTRTGFLRVLERMGADVDVTVSPIAPGYPRGDEPVGILAVRGTSTLTSTTITRDEVPSLIDEVPILSLAATQATGTTRFEGVGELRVKESDRLSALAVGLTALGAEVTAGEDWLQVTGPTALRGAKLESLGDHRLAMTWIVAGLIAEEAVVVGGADAVGVSYPAFVEDLTGLFGADGDAACQ